MMPCPTESNEGGVATEDRDTRCMACKGLGVESLYSHVRNLRFDQEFSASLSTPHLHNFSTAVSQFSSQRSAQVFGIRPDKRSKSPLPVSLVRYSRTSQSR